MQPFIRKFIITGLIITAAVAAMAGRNPKAVQAGLYANQSVHGSVITLCFVGGAVNQQPDRVAQILDYIREFEYAANIKFDYWGACPAPTRQANGDDFYAGDIRVIIPGIDIDGSGAVPGQGCAKYNQQSETGYDGGNDGWGSWADLPAELDRSRSCLYNLKLGNDPWTDTPYLNHTLHEFGHALGLAHEHERSDATCPEPGWVAHGHLTPYDPQSVMHYRYDQCGIVGNYGHTGLSNWDRLALHILYPEDNRAAEFIGTTVIRQNDTLRLRSAWQARGANLETVASDFAWRLNGTTVSRRPELNIPLNRPGVYRLELTHQDFLGRSYRYIGTVRVLGSNAYDRQMAAVSAAQIW